MEIIKIISEHKKIRINIRREMAMQNTPVAPGYKRVEAIVRDKGRLFTRHIDVKK